MLQRTSNQLGLVTLNVFSEATADPEGICCLQVVAKEVDGNAGTGAQSLGVFAGAAQASIRLIVQAGNLDRGQKAVQLFDRRELDCTRDIDVSSRFDNTCRAQQHIACGLITAKSRAGDALSSERLRKQR